MSSEIYLGIDPGASGYVCGLDNDRTVRLIRPLCKAEDVPLLAEIIHDAVEFMPRARVYCVLEHVSGHWAEGKSTSSFAFGRSLGQLEMALYACGVPYSRVTPKDWQEFFGLSKKDCQKIIERNPEKMSTRKEVHQAKARKLLPGYDWSQANADAGLLALYCYGRNTH